MAEVREKQNKAKVAAPKLVAASARGLHISPRKMRLATNLVKNMRVEDALTQLAFTDKKAAGMLAKLLKSAVANAENNFSLDPAQLYIKSLTCDMGQVAKRYFPRARGSAFVIRRKMSHVNVVLEERAARKGSKNRFSFLQRRAKKEEAKPVGSSGVTPEASNTPTPPEESGAKKPVPKTSELRKSNVVQQKRRLFSRKTGE